MLDELSPFQKQLIKFTIIGILAVLVDLTCYYILLNILPKSFSATFSNEAIAKAMSFVCGMGVTYTFNKYWTWKQTDRSKKRVVKFGILYGCSLLINVSINSLVLYILMNYEFFVNFPFKYLIAFVAATGVSTCVNFIGQKFWVFKFAE